jgi:hypothetical protein
LFARLGFSGVWEQGGNQEQYEGQDTQGFISRVGFVVYKNRRS